MAFPTAETNVPKHWLFVQNCYKHSLCLVALWLQMLFFLFCFPVEMLPLLMCAIYLYLTFFPILDDQLTESEMWENLHGC